MKTLHAFNVLDLQTKEMIHFHRVNDEEWKMVKLYHTETISNESALKAYDYFSSHWMDFEVE